MKKIIFLTLCVLSQMVSLQAFDVEARVAYFLPQDSTMRDLYGKNGLPEYEIEVSTPLTVCCETLCNWDAFANVSYFYGKGHTSCLRYHTDVNNWAFNVGLKRFFDTCTCFKPYLGLGIGFAYVDFNDRSEFVKQHRDQWGFALLAKSGIRYDLTCNLYADLFVDYAFNWFRFHNSGCSSSRNLDTGGVKVGLGLGYGF